jgi:hypothetical protein
LVVNSPSPDLGQIVRKVFTMVVVVVIVVTYCCCLDKRLHLKLTHSRHFRRQCVAHVSESHYDQRGRQIGKDFHAPVVVVTLLSVIRTELAVAAVMVVNSAGTLPRHPWSLPERETVHECCGKAIEVVLLVVVLSSASSPPPFLQRERASSAFESIERIKMDRLQRSCTCACTCTTFSRFLLPTTTHLWYSLR